MNNGYSSQSLGPSVDGLDLKFRGAVNFDQDYARTQRVELTIVGTVTGHEFVDKYKEGNVEHTTKVLKLQVDEIIEHAKVDPARHRGQTHMDDDGTPRHHDGSAVEETTTTVPEQDRVVDAEVVGELEGDVMDPETGEVIPHGGDPEPEPPEIFRHPQIAEEAWRELNREQREEANGRVERLEKLATALANPDLAPVDRDTYETRMSELTDELRQDFGIELLEPEEVPEPPARPAIGAVTESSPDIDVADLKARKDYLESLGSMPAEAEEARRVELAEINRRLGDGAPA